MILLNILQKVAIYNTISSSRHEKICLMRLRFDGRSISRKVALLNTLVHDV